MQSTDLENLVAGSGYKFSATKIGDLGAAEYTLVTIVVDNSGSVTPFASSLETALKTVLKACEKSPRRDNLLMRMLTFNQVIKEVHGFKLLSNVSESDYTGVVNPSGSTALYAAAEDGISATSTYGKMLTDQEFLVNGIVVQITDGQEEAHTSTAANVNNALLTARRAETLQSLLTILIGVTNDDDNLNSYLQSVKDECGFDQYVSIGKATPGKIAKLAEFISHSISSTSASLASGTQSKPIAHTF